MTRKKRITKVKTKIISIASTKTTEQVNPLVTIEEVFKNDSLAYLEQ